MKEDWVVVGRWGGEEKGKGKEEEEWEEKVVEEEERMEEEGDGKRGWGGLLVKMALKILELL
jgi:hypothetical protein